MFETSFFATPNQLLMGAIAGFLFGFLLQKGGVTRFNVIVNQFLLRDFTVAKIMGTAIVVGGVGVYAMLQLGWIDSLSVKASHLLGNAVGGVIFGAGMALLGYCPGTAIGAAADGAKDAWFGILGGLVGAAVYAEAHPWINANILSIGDLGKETIATSTGLSPWWFMIGLALVAAGGFWALERWEHRRPGRHAIAA
jgi:hypothetical protein